MNKVMKIGIEIEGEFSARVKKALRKKGDVKGDGSVHNCDSANCRRLEACEFASTPIDLIYKYDFDKLVKARPIFSILKNAKKRHEFHWNNSCGFHVHVSFDRPKFPPELFSKQFCDYFYASLKKEFPEVWESRKDNRFCRAFNDEIEIAQRNTDRYRGINLWAAREKHNTIEFRIFPSNNPAAMEKYLQFILITIKKFLTKGINIKVETEMIETEDFNQSTTREVFLKGTYQTNSEI